MEEGVYIKKFYLVTHIFMALMIVTAILILAASVRGQTNAQEVVIINSKDWRDVYSGVLYAKLAAKQSQFLVSDKHALIYLETLNAGSDYFLIESSRTYYSGFESSLKNSNYEVTRFSESNNNIALGEKAVEEEGIENFIIVDDSYGYFAVAAASYAVVSRSYVLFADRTNIDQVVDFLDDVTVNSVTVVGHTNREVLDALATYNPDVIDEGNRFATNIEIVKRYREINPQKQVVITNGEFIEDEIMSGIEPVVFIGTDNIPEVTKEYFRNSEIDIAVLIGNDLVRAATTIRRELDVTTFVKFARSARVPTESLSKIEGLDLFWLPKYELGLAVETARYNELSNELEVTYKNTGAVGVFFSSTITIRTEDGEDETLGDEDAIFIEEGESRTITYTPSNPIIKDSAITFFVTFGESADTMEKIIELKKKVEFIRVLDNSKLVIKEVFYDEAQSAFGVVVENTGDVQVHATAELIDVLIEEAAQTIGSKRTARVAPGAEATVYIRQRMTELDLLDNPTVLARAYYGQRETALIKIATGEFELQIKEFPVVRIVLIAGAIILVLFFIILLWRRRKKKKKVHYHHVSHGGHHHHAHHGHAGHHRR